MKRFLLLLLLTSSLHAQTSVTACETTGVFGAGFTYDFTPRWGVALDARYMPLMLGGEPEPGERIEASLDPLIVSAGVRVRF